MEIIITLLAVIFGIYLLGPLPLLGVLLLLTGTILLCVVVVPAWIYKAKLGAYADGAEALGPFWKLRRGDMRTGIIVGTNMFFVTLANVDHPERRYRCLPSTLRIREDESPKRAVVQPAVDKARKHLKRSRLYMRVMMYLLLAIIGWILINSEIQLGMLWGLLLISVTIGAVLIIETPEPMRRHPRR